MQINTQAGDSLLRCRDIVTDRKRGTRGILPIGRSAWLAGVRSGIYPHPLRLNGATVWKYSQIMRLVEEGAQ